MIAVRNAIALFLLLLITPSLAAGETITLEAARDATLIEDANGELANGSGPVFFVGRTNQRQDSVRRGMVYFDVAAVLPKNSRVERVRLTLYVTPSNPAPRIIELHRLVRDWGEGPSSASGGGGDVSVPGDATWIHAFYDDMFWVKPGADFVAHPSASLEVADSAFYTWENTPQMRADVRSWLAAPQRNFGWVLIGDETTPQNVKSVASRENDDFEIRPVLEIEYAPPRR